ncbi:alpha-L-rhamnosidase [Acinetobacter sp. MB5]|uniref:alpha-L-rhamnosidase n=1 Tax=Acinetobacter sp. MB5 TaxID=2069438 RepID=UPI000DCF8A4F|nr:alpha-L-rhamnosidase [Acinetobacter sp. MB5]
MINIYDLKCEYQKNPLGIDVLEPALMWKISADTHGVKQTAYQLIMTENLEDMNDENSYFFNSGKVFSEQSTNILYSGSALQSRQRYYWKVRIWDQFDQVTEWSAIAWWEMGLLHASDWCAIWIEPVQKVAKQESVKHPGELFSPIPDPIQVSQRELMPCQYVRRVFEFSGKPETARLYITAHGIYDAKINGQKISDQLLAPGATAYQDYLEYQTYDVTDFLKAGQNVLAVTLADGWYAGRLGLPGVNQNYGDKVGVLFQLELRDTSGELTQVVSDDQCRSSTGPIEYSDLYIGEKYDANKAQAGWDSSGFDDQNWQAVIENQQYGVKNLIAQCGEPIRIVQEITNMRIIQTPNGEQLLDLGQVISGWLRINVQAKKGTEIQLEFTETLDEHGNFFRNIVGKNKDQTDIYVANGQGVETWEPQFTFHGFRYVRVTGSPEKLRAENFVGVVIGSDLEITGKFKCSDERINQLQSCILWSQRGNFISIPTDCPQREKAGWTGDINIYAPTAIFNMQSYNFLKRWLHNLRLEQQADGQVPTIIPFWQGDRKFSEMLMGQGKVSCSGWGDVCIMLPWELWQKYGDKRILIENYSTMKNWLAYVKKEAESFISESALNSGDQKRIDNQKYLWNSGFHFGDWFTPSFLKADPTHNGIMHCAHVTKDLVSSAFYAHSTKLMAQIAEILGKPHESCEYAALHAKVKQAFIDEYFDEDYKLTPHYQGAYVIALAFDLVPVAAIKIVTQHLVNLIVDNNFTLDTGFMSVSYLMNVLTQYGQEDLSWKLLFQNQSPSWLYEIEKGATTLWERWDNIGQDNKPLHSSFNHYAFGCVGDWMYQHIAGIQCHDIGYKKIKISPCIDQSIDYCDASYISDYGEIKVSWERKDSVVRLSVHVPCNTSAQIILPHSAQSEIYENRDLIENCDGILNISRDTKHTQINLNSGLYHFNYTMV